MSVQLEHHYLMLFYSFFHSVFLLLLLLLTNENVLYERQSYRFHNIMFLLCTNDQGEGTCYNNLFNEGARLDEAQVSHQPCTQS